MEFSELLKKKISFVSLGCDKNRVDLEKIIQNLKSNSFEIVPLEEAQIVIINTCSFIEEARKESIDWILKTSLLKMINIEKIVVSGCINNMNYTDLQSSLPEVDAWIKPEDNQNIISVIAGLYNVTSLPKLNYCNTDRFISTPKHYAYLKIADGCNNFCSYCTIPYIRGRYRSEKLEDLVVEANKLVDSGVKEIILVAQDVTKYGDDIYGKPSLVKLIQELSKIDRLIKIRLLYCYPDLITDELIKEMAVNNKVAKYIDMPLQHIDDEILKKMNRRTNYHQICSIIRKLRQVMPNIKIRTTFIIGFPGETQSHFDNLYKFIDDYKLDYVGFFKYSKEEGTRAFNMPNQVPYKEKCRRLSLVSQKQFEVVSEKNQSLLGKVLECVLDKIEGDKAIFRWDNCPDVDSVIFVKNEPKLVVGQCYKIKITKVLKYDLKGEIYEFTK